jgi:hypothetical protein
MLVVVSVSRLAIPAVPKTIVGAECAILVGFVSRIDRKNRKV